MNEINNGNIVGAHIGIYDILYECDYKGNDGHKIYHVKCSVCGWETDMQKGDIKRAKTCTHIRKLTQEQIDEWYDKNKKQCLYCGKDIPFIDKSFNKYLERNFCSQSCSASYNNKKYKIKQRPEDYCKNCGKPIKYPNKYCSNKCQQEFIYKSYIKRWKDGDEDGMCGEYGISWHIKRYLFDKYNNQCCKCGWHEINPTTGKVPLEVHHIDGNYKNNKEDNLELLCPNCHSLTPTYKRLNNGSGRKERKKYN